jgi:hypothetical protein
LESATELEISEAIKTAIDEMVQSEEAPKEAPKEDDDETLDGEDSIKIDWGLLDLAMLGILSEEDALLSVEDKAELTDQAFCGPERSFPIADCAHLKAARKLIDRFEDSNPTKNLISSIVEEKAKNLDCDKSEEYTKLRKDFDTLQAQYLDLEDKFKSILESLIVKNKKKDEEKVEIESNDALIDDNTTILDKRVENPSEHIQDEMVSSKKEVKLPSFEQKIVDEYRKIKNESGEYSADLYLSSKSFYLPKGFDPNKF